MKILPKSNKGHIHVYTGDGKGKTTAALGLALRAMGRGMRSYMAQFMKKQEYGEIIAANKLTPYVTIEQFGKNTFTHVVQYPLNDDIKSAQKGLQKAREAMLFGSYDIIILDEVTVAIYYNLLSTKSVLQFMNKKPPSIELILTGRYAQAEIINAADLVTEMVEVKHYFNRGILARVGIER